MKPKNPQVLDLPNTAKVCIFSQGPGQGNTEQEPDSDLFEDNDPAHVQELEDNDTDNDGSDSFDEPYSVPPSPIASGIASEAHFPTAFDHFLSDTVQAAPSSPSASAHNPPPLPPYTPTQETEMKPSIEAAKSEDSEDIEPPRKRQRIQTGPSTTIENVSGGKGH